ncbi:MAG: RNHCP domain-containing protein [Pseudomonadota bacterium]|nr:RNHCP domain-containing protein [Pseudomonadota bacterium]
MKTLEARLAALRTRGEIKDLAAEVERDAALRGELVELATARGLVVEPDDSAKRLVRALLGRADAAQVRKNPIHRDDAFTCAHCGAAVSPGGAPVRDHCPRCLRGLHVDVVPGDRAASCGGVLDPIAFERRPEVVIRYRCRRCAHSFVVRAHPDDRIPPSLCPSDVQGPA